MRGALGLLLIGGGAFTLIALFNGTLKFPLGNVNLFGSSLGGVSPNTGLTDTQYTSGTLTPTIPNQKPVGNKCNPGYVLYQGQCVPSYSTHGKA